MLAVENKIYNISGGIELRVSLLSLATDECFHLPLSFSHMMEKKENEKERNKCGGVNE